MENNIHNKFIALRSLGWFSLQHIVPAILSAIVLSSCGGGGSGSGSSSASLPVTATMQTGTIVVGSTEVGTSVTVSSDSAGQRVLTMQNADSKLTNAQIGQVIAFEANSAMPLGFAGIVQSVQTTSVSGVPSTTAIFAPAGIADVFQNLNLNLNMSNVATNPQLMAGVPMQNGVRAYTKTEPAVSHGIMGTIQNGLIEINLLPKLTNTAVGIDFGDLGIKASFWKVNGKWVPDDPHTSAAKVDINFTGNIELQNPNFSQANIVIENGKLVTHNLQLQGTLKRNIKATVTGNFQASAADLGELFSAQPTSRFYTKNSTYNEISFDYKGNKIKIYGVTKDPSKIILGAVILGIGRVQPTFGNSQTGNNLKTVPVGMVVTFFMTADMQVEATASLGYQWRDMDINAGMGFSYNDSLGLPVSLATGQYKTPVPFWNAAAHQDQPQGVSYDVSGSASTTLTAGVDAGIVLVGLEIAQATVEGGIRGSLSGQFGKLVGQAQPTGCWSNASVTAGVRALLDVAAGVELKTDFKSKWLKWLDASVNTGYVYEFPMYPGEGVDWLAETTIWSVGDDTCHLSQFSATAGTALYNYGFDATATGYQPMVSSYTWGFGDGATATGVTTTHTYSAPGNYTATLTVLFSDGIQKIISKTITVMAVPALNPAFTVNFTGLQASFDASTSTPSADIVTYDWSFGDNATASGVTATHTYAAYSNTPWSVTLTATDSYGRTASVSQNVSATCPTGQVLQNGQCVTPTPVTTSTLNDTGITSTQCYQAGSDVLVDCGSAGAIALNNAQDGMAGRDANAATNSNTDGKLGFSFASVTGGCVQDNVTGLMWEVKTTDGGLRDWNKTYTNYSAAYNPNGLYGTATDASGFVTAVNATNLCGYGDWRLPTADELQSIVDYGVAYPAIDTTWFPNTQGSAFWSASPVVGFSHYAWGVNLSNGSVTGSGYYRDTTFYVRLVRSSQSPTPPRYSVSADGQEVTDNQTKLIWRRCAEGMMFSGGTCTGTASTFTHEAALQRAAAQASSTGMAWRLPNLKELSSIIDIRLINPAIDSSAFPATSVSWFWSASPVVGETGFAWAISFYDHFVHNYYRYGAWDVRLVRTAP